jgi:hypothetical protein
MGEPCAPRRELGAVPHAVNGAGLPLLRRRNGSTGLRIDNIGLEAWSIQVRLGRESLNVATRLVPEIKPVAEIQKTRDEQGARDRVSVHEL